MSLDPINSHEPEDEAPNAASPWYQNPTVFIIIAILGLGLATVFGIMLFRPEEETSTEVPPTPFPETVGDSLRGQPIIEVIDGSSTVSMTVDIPITVSLSGRDFGLQPQAIAADGIWSPAFSSEGTAVWVYGSIVNYIIGLPNSDENRAMLEGLIPGSEIMVRTEQGQELGFTFENRSLVPSINRDVFAQTTPGVTVVLLGAEGDNRLVVNGRYVVPDTAQAGATNVVQLGEPVQLADVQTTVTGATYLSDRPEAPPGFAFYLVDFQIQNTGLTAVNLDTLQFVLADELGNQYALNPIASQLGNNQPASGFLNAGQILAASAGYQIPSGLVSNNLNWHVNWPDVGGQVQVTIPFNGTQSSGQNASIALQSVNVSPDFTSLVLTGQVTNIGEQPLVITERDISLGTADGSTYLMLSTNPAFPWTTPPGQTLQFTVTFQRPLQASEALFIVLNQPFQLSNLQ
ncbi:MAG: DUF4352 domain-containing protein [Chloroflexota bacterium]